MRPPTTARQPTFAEFFAGGGMARAGLGPGWRCVLANDVDPRKCAAYRANWGGDDLIEGDVAALDPGLLRRPLDLVWASGPCQDFSLAGKGAGLGGARSGAFEPWRALVGRAVEAGFAPRLVAFENVTGLLTSRGGADLRRVLGAFADLGYRVGAVEIDARAFLPQSRPRLFVIAARGALPDSLAAAAPSGPFLTPRLRRAADALPPEIAAAWVWWRLPAPPAPNVALADLIDRDGPHDWFDAERVARLLAIMTPRNREKVEALRAAGGFHVGTVYKRGRPDAAGVIRQRAEARFDGVAGCLRTPAGGSSRQTLMAIEEGRVAARLLTAREAARLMGLPEDYRLPARYNDAYRLAGDGVAPPVVAFLRDALFLPLLDR